MESENHSSSTFHIGKENYKPELIDLIIFAGQSNMAGRGISNKEYPEGAPAVPEVCGLEYRAISKPNCLTPISEPFGFAENSPNGIDDRTLKTGSLVSSFINEYHKTCGVTVIAVSASKGGSSLCEWQPGTKYFNDLIARYHDAKRYLKQQKIEIRHQYLVWCQGETDGDLGTSEDQFKTMFRQLKEALISAGIDAVLLISIGQCNIAGSETRYDPVIRWESELSQEPKVHCISKAFIRMRDRGLMKDEFTYFQQGYNECGAEAGHNAGIIALQGIDNENTY